MDFRKCKHLTDSTNNLQRSLRQLTRILILAVILAVTTAGTIQAQLYDGFLYWLTDIPNYDEKANSGHARVDGRMYCTDSFYLWNFSTFVFNENTCGNGARLINWVEIDGHLVDPSCETDTSSIDQASFRSVVLTVVPGAIWCGSYTNSGVQSPWEQEIT